MSGPPSGRGWMRGRGCTGGDGQPTPTELAGGNRNWQAGIVRIFGKGRHRPSASWRQATDRAFSLIGDGRYEDAGALLTRAADLEPWLSESWFNLALLHKFRHDWEQARTAGLRAVALLDRESGAPDWWNVGIAATALQDWPLARRAWQAYGLRVPGDSTAPGHGHAGAVG